MAFDDERDWIDEVMRSGGTWDPPPNFSERVVLRAAAAGAMPAVRPRRARAFDVAGFARDLLTRGFDHVLGRIEGSAWVIRQYRELLLR
jgi:hypothetical protein